MDGTKKKIRQLETSQCNKLMLKISVGYNFNKMATEINVIVIQICESEKMSKK